MVEMSPEKSWEEFLRMMLPPGAVIPDYEHLDYSIATEYKGPPLAIDLPLVHPLRDPPSVSLTLPTSPSQISSVSEQIPVMEPIRLRSSKVHPSTFPGGQVRSAEWADSDKVVKPISLRSPRPSPLLDSCAFERSDRVGKLFGKELKDSDAERDQPEPEEKEIGANNSLALSANMCETTAIQNNHDEEPICAEEPLESVNNNKRIYELSVNDSSISELSRIDCLYKPKSATEDPDETSSMSEKDDIVTEESKTAILSSFSSLSRSCINNSTNESHLIIKDGRDPYRPPSIPQSGDRDRINLELFGETDEAPQEIEEESRREEANVSSSKRFYSVESSASMDEGSFTSSPPSRMQQTRQIVPVTFDISDASVDDDSDSCLSRTINSSLDSSTTDGSSHGGVRRKVRKRRICSMCGRINFLKGIESCLVCGARYCGNCMFKAMGSMPEGRKCLTCIGKPIAEAKRRRLGHSSRLLRHLCCPLEIKQIMKTETECRANQLHPGQINVNGRPLKEEELFALLSCQTPPGKLKPGRYWYDKVSGFWGKDGEKPYMLISPKLDIGGILPENASNGNTEVYFNGREITKEELRVLKWVKIQCSPKTNFWVYDDGSVVEEGQKNPLGNIWEKAASRLLCSLLSLPVPHQSGDRTSEDANNRVRNLPQYLEGKTTHKLLLLGSPGAGTSTIFKQIKHKYGTFSDEELEDMKFLIQTNIYKYLGVLLEARERFEEESLREDENGPSIYSLNARLKQFSDLFLEILATGNFDAFFPAASREYASVLVDLWNDAAIQETYKRRDEIFSLPDNVNYFLDKAMHITDNAYVPSEEDILHAEGLSLGDGLATIDFSLDNRGQITMGLNMNSEESPAPLTKYQLIRLGANCLSEGCKWYEMFEDVRAIIFCVSLTDYDQIVSVGRSAPLMNKLMQSKELFESMVRHPCFQDIPFVLVLNKFDLFVKKIDRVPLTVCGWFKDFCPMRSNRTHSSLAHQAYFYVAMKFKRLYGQYSRNKLFVWQSNAKDRHNVEGAFNFIKEVLIWNDEKNGYQFLEDWQYTDATSNSQITRG